ncbi:MAG: YitT family protein [Clostridium sp.]|uniref:YitT family protein n=1 Tax=Clostridium sp. TaxID=1506 RepID=UPI003F2C6BC7
MVSSRKNAKRIALIILGASILAFGSYNLNYQNDVTEGGVLGLMLLLQHLFNISPSITSIIIDFSLFCIGMKFLGKKFLLLASLSTVTFSITYKMWESIGFIIPNLTNHMILASILAGICVGVGVGIVVRAGAASGGDDVIAIIVSKFTRFKMNHMYYIMDATVLLLSLTYISYEKIIYSVIAVLVSGKLISVIYEIGRSEAKISKESKVIENPALV